MKTMMMSKHYIYEIFGRKIGATNDVERRMKQQGAKEGEYRIIEEHTNAKTCSIREIELQKEFNYPVDKIQYWKTLKWSKKSQTPQAQKKRVANTDYKAISKKIDYKARTANTNYKARTIKTDYKTRTANMDWVAKAEKCKKPINQYDLEGNFIKRWDSITDAAIKLNAQIASIGKCCKGKGKTANKSIWKYAG